MQDLILKQAIVFLFAFLATSSAAQAYIGPGLGAGAVATVIGIIGAIVLSLFAVIYYPIKRFLRTRKNADSDAENTSPENK